MHEAGACGGCGRHRHGTPDVPHKEQVEELIQGRHRVHRHLRRVLLAASLKLDRFGCARLAGRARRLLLMPRRAPGARVFLSAWGSSLQ